MLRARFLITKLTKITRATNWLPSLLILSASAIDAQTNKDSCDRLNIAGSDNMYPISYVQPNTKEIRGIAFELLRYLGERLGIPVIVHPNRPQARMINMAHEGEIDIVAGLAYTPKRATFLHFTRPFYRATLYAYTQRDNPMQLSAIEDLKNFSRANIRGNTIGVELDQLLKRSTVTVNNEAERVAAVLGGRVDYLTSTTPEFSRLKQTYKGLDNLRRLPLALIKLEARLGISKASPCSQHLETFNQMIAELYLPIDDSRATY